MSYGYVNEDGAWPKEPRFIKWLFWFIPRANPDIESLFPMVRRWALELDSSGKPIREVGLGDENRVLFKAPDHRNRGMWTDSSVLIQNIEPMNEESFNSLWENAPNNHA